MTETWYASAAIATNRRIPNPPIILVETFMFRCCIAVAYCKSSSHPRLIAAQLRLCCFRLSRVSVCGRNHENFKFDFMTAAQAAYLAIRQHTKQLRLKL